MKKLISMLFAVIMVVAMAVPAFAAVGATVFVVAPRCTCGTNCGAHLEVTREYISGLSKKTETVEVKAGTKSFDPCVSLTVKAVDGSCGSTFVSYAIKKEFLILSDENSTSNKRTYTLSGSGAASYVYITASYTKPTSYTVTYTDGVEDEVVFADQSYTVLKDSATPAFNGTPERKGYSFEGWSPEVSGTVTANVTYVAQWAKTYTVTYTDGANGAAFADEVYTVKEGEATPAFAGSTDNYPGFNFRGWSPAVTDTVTGDVTYIAQWANKGANTLYYYGNGGKTTGNYPSGTYSNYTNENYITVLGNGTIGFVREGYTFSGWNDKEDGTGKAYTAGSRYNFAVAHNLEKGYLYAQWTKNTYTVTYTDGVNGTAFENQSHTAAYGDATPAFNGNPERKGYTFAGWEPAVAETVTENVTYVAQWTKTYTVTYKDPYHSFEDQVYTVEAGGKVPAFVGTPEREGYVFSTWNNHYDSVTGPAGETVDKDRVFSARWTKLPDDLTVEMAKRKTALRLTDVKRPNGNYDLRNEDLIDGTFTVSESVWNAEKRAVLATVTVNKADFDKYSAALEAIEGYTYHFKELGDRAEADANGNLVIHLKNAARYKGNQRPNQHGSNRELYFGGWLLDTDYYPGASRPQMLFDRYYTVTYTDGAEGKAFETETYTVKEGEATPAFTGSTDNYTGFNFKGWNPTVAATVTANATYTAKWANKGANTLYYYGNGGFTSSGVDFSSNYTNAASISVSGNGDTGFVREGYAFTGWNTKEDGTGTAYKAGDTYYFTAAHNLEKGYLYAQWNHTACSDHLEDVRVITEPTCTEKGEKLCRCTVCSKEFKVELNALGHDWAAATYEWKAVEGGYECTAKRVCNRDASHVETETVNATYAEITPATCLVNGKGRYTATFTADWAKTQTKDIVLKALGHDHSGKWIYNREDHWKKCTRCGEILDLHEHDFTDWTFEYKSKTDKYRDCKVCGYHQEATVINIGGNTVIKPNTEHNPNTGAELFTSVKAVIGQNRIDTTA